MMRLDEFTKDLLDGVDQGRHGEALYTLRHSWAARGMFAEAQMVYALFRCEDGCDSGELFAEVMDFCNCMEKVSTELMVRHWWRRGPLRMYHATSARFLRLIEELYVPNEKDEWGDESLCRTILGWWQY